MELRFIEEGETSSFVTLQATAWQPGVDDHVTLSGVRWKVERLEFFASIAGASDPFTAPSGPGYISEEYCEVTVSVPV